MTLARRVAWNTVAQATARVGTLTLSVVVTVLLTRHLGVDGYGAYVTVTVYVPFFALFFDSGVTTLVVRSLSTEPDRTELFREALGLRLALAVPVALLAYGLAWALYGGSGDASIREGIAIALPIILLSSASSTLSAVFQARLQMDRVGLAEVVGQIVGAGLIVTIVVLGGSLDAVIGALVAGILVNVLVLAVLAARRTSVRPSFRPRRWLALLRRALPLGLALMISTIYFRADAILLSILKGPHAVGIYGVAYRLLEALIAFPGFFYVSVFPLLSQAFARRDLGNVREVAQRSFDLLVIAAVPVVFGTMVAAPEIVSALAGSRFHAAVTPLRIVIGGAGLFFVNGLFTYVLIAIDRQVLLLWSGLGTLTFNVALNLALIPSYSYTAAAAVATGSELLTLVILLALVRRYTGYLPALGVTLKAAVAGAAMVGVLLVIPSNLAAIVVVGAVVYGAMLMLLRTHRSLELRELLGAGR
jgi:O-antigen/teichoic acid export membrane protein